MQSTPNLQGTDPHDVFVMEPDVSLAARADKAPLDLLYDVLSNPSAPRPPDPACSQVRPDPELRVAPDFSAGAAVPPVDTAVRGIIPDEAAFNDSRLNDIRLGDTEIGAHQPATSKLARAAVMGLFALVSAMGAAGWQHYGDDAKAMVANWTPPFSLGSLAATTKPATTEPAPAVEAAAADHFTAPPSASAQPAANASAAVVSVAPEQAQQLQSMARDLAAMGQQIGELKATIEQLRASQAQMAQAQITGEPAKTTEARLTEAAPRPRIAPPPPLHAATTPLRKPKQVFPYAPIASASPPQAAAPVQITPQVQAAEDGGPVVRPPMPLH